MSVNFKSTFTKKIVKRFGRKLTYFLKRTFFLKHFLDIIKYYIVLTGFQVKTNLIASKKNILKTQKSQVP